MSDFKSNLRVISSQFIVDLTHNIFLNPPIYLFLLTNISLTVILVHWEVSIQFF